MKRTKKSRSKEIVFPLATAKTRTVPPKSARGRPTKARPDTPPAPTPPIENLKYLENLLLRLVSPLKSLPVQTNEAVVYIRPEDIAYISTTAERRILIVDREGREWRRFDSIKALKDRLAPDPRFFLSHKSFLVNIFAVKTLRKNSQTNRHEVTFGDKVKGAAAVSAGNLKKLRDLLEL